MTTAFVSPPNLAYIESVEGTELREKRKELKLTQKGLADKLRVDPNTVARWERGEMALPPFLDLALQTIERNLKPSK